MSDKRLLSDDEVFGRPQGRLLTDAEVMGSPASRPAPAKTTERPGFLADVARNAVPWLAEGVNNIAGAPFDLVAPEGGAAAFFRDNAEWWRGTQSDSLQQRQKAASQRIDEAGRDGVMSQIGSAASEYADDPALAARLAVTNIPSLVPGLALGKAAQAAGVAAKLTPAAIASLGLGVASGTNATLNAGGARGESFEDLKRAAMARGLSEADATELALEGSKLPAAIGAATGAISGRIGLEKALLGQAGAGAVAKRAIGATAAELAGEQLEEVSPKIAGNLAAQSLDADRRLSSDVGRTIVETGVGSGPTSVAAGIGSAYRDIKATPPALDPAATPAADAAEVLGTPAAAEPSAAEKALRTLRPLTALDRAQEIDQLLAAAPDAPEAPALAAERDQIAASWPKLDRGNDTSFSTEAGARVEGRYALVEADSLQASHDTDLRPNPAYPQELQPRDRSRAASEAQISSIVGKLDPARLGLSADAANGAPIIGSDGLVESGNARTIALQRIYRQNGQKAVDYKTWLRDNAAQFGLTPERIDGMRAPVLVRERTTPVDRAEFARQANASTVAAMSPTEQARADAARIDVMEDLRPDDQGDFTTSRDFIRRFVGRLPGTERSAMIDAAGQLSSAGYARVRNAVLAKAYGDSPILTRMVESMDDNLRNVSRALMIAAPRVAQARAAMGDGRLFDADITPHLISAVEELGRLKDSGGSVQDALAQAGLMGDQYSPETRELLQFLADNMRRPRRMAEFVTAYFDALEAAGDPAQGSLLGDVTPPTTGDLMTAARRTTEEVPRETTTQDTQRRDAGAAAQDGAGDGRQPEAAPSGRRGDQGDEAANQPVGPTPDDARAAAVADFKAAAGEVLEILTRNQRAAIVPENTPGLMPALKKLAGTAIVMVGTELRAIVAHVRAAMKADPNLKKWHAKVETALIRKAAEQALAELQNQPSAQMGLFDAAEAKAAIEQGDLFAAAPRRDPNAPGETVDSDWKDFPASMGGLGFERADMPQLAPGDMPEVIDHFFAMGITSRIETMPASGLKPSQLEYSETKVSRAARFEGSGATVIVSKDGYVLDGHHRWLAQQRAGKDVRAVVVNAPAQEVLRGMREFILGERRPGETDKQFAKRVVDKRVTPRVLPENHGAYFTTEMASVVPIEQLRSTKTDEQNEQGGENGAKRMAAAAKGELAKRAPITVMPSATERGAYDVVDGNGTLTSVKRYGWESLPVQIVAREQGLRMMAEDKAKDEKKAAAARTKIDGRDYVFTDGGDNYSVPEQSTAIAPDVLTAAQSFVDQHKSDAKPAPISDYDRKLAESMLAPALKRAADVQKEFNEKVIAVAKRTGAIGQMLVLLKGLKRAAEKLVNEEHFNLEGMKDLVRSTIVVRSYDEAADLVEAIKKDFKVLRVKDKTTEVERKKAAGYADVTVNVVMPNGVIGEIQINVPPMLSAKGGVGHTLYEVMRDQPDTSALRDQAYDLMWSIYDPVFRAARMRATTASTPPSVNALQPSAEDRKPASDMGAPVLGSDGTGLSVTPSSASLNTRPSGNLTKSSPEKLATNSQPGGNSSGTLIEDSIVVSPSGPIVSDRTKSQYIINREEPQNGTDPVDGNPGQGAEGTGAEVSRGTDGQGGTPGVSPRSVGPGDGGSGQRRGAGQRASDKAGPGLPAKGPDDEQREPKRAGDRAGAGRGEPAGREIRPKSGLNYRFTDDDISPPGSWRKRAGWNVEAVEVVKKLAAENRKATPEEQKTLAKFVGWGASEIANNLFGAKLDKIEGILPEYERAMAAIDKAGGTLRRDRWARYSGTPDGWFDAFAVLRAANPNLMWNDLDQITSEQVKKAGPSKDARDWLALRDRLKAALTPEEWAEAARSTQYGHYTSAPIVRGMWGALERFGFKGGLVLEPGGGKGNFPGLMPADLAANTAYTGIEYDSITGAILGHLFPDENVRVESYMDSKLPKNFYDVGIGNPPFAGFPVLSDPEYRKHAFKLHDYFFAKTLDRVRPGGLLMFVTSRFTMDKSDDAARAYMADRADLMGAIRLPQTAFKDNAGTEVVTDILFLRKKAPGESFEGGQAWAGVVPATDADGKPLMVSGGTDKDGNTLPDVQATVNEYFAAHPEMILGKQANTGSMYRDKEYTVLPLAGDIAELFKTAIERMPADVFAPPAGSAAQAAQVRDVDFNPKAKKEGGFYLSDAGVLMQREGGLGHVVIEKGPRAGKKIEGKTREDIELLSDYVPLRDALKQAQYDQLNGGDWEASLAELQAAYSAFTKKHGPLNQSTVMRRKVTIEVEQTDEDGNIVEDDDGNPVMVKEQDEVESRVYPLLNRLMDDPDYTLVAALEDVNEETGQLKPAKSLSDRVLGGKPAPTISTPHDAMMTVLADTGRIDMGAIADKLDITEQEAAEALGAAVYQNPQGQAWETADSYLSGNVKQKLAEAREAARTDSRYERNVSALEAVQPPGRSPADVNIRIGMNWIPSDVYEQFLRETAGVKARVTFNEAVRKWSIRYTEHVVGNKPSRATVDWGTYHRHTGELMEHALTGRKVRVFRSEGVGKDRKQVFDAAASEASNAKLTALQDEFSAWVWRDAERTTRLITLYNDKFNTTIGRHFDGRHLTMPGSSRLIDVYDHVKRGAWRIIQTGNTYLAHAVGSGKTWAAVISAMEQRRLGLIKKPIFVVPNHMLGQWQREWLQLYPAAKLMVADEANFTGDNRRRFIARAALNDLDGIIITHDAFKKLDLDPKFKARMIQEQLVELRAAIMQQAADEEAESGKKGHSNAVKRMEKRVQALEEKLKSTLSGEGKDKSVRLDEMGVDMMYVDEAHVARKLDIATSRQVKGITTTGSELSMSLYQASRYLDEKNPGRSLVMLSGTPLTNTMGEMYTVQRFLGRQALIDKGIDDFDSWASQFGRESTSLEANAAGKYEQVTRFKKFVNVGELTTMFREFADVLTADTLAQFLGDKRPKVRGGVRRIIVTPLTAAYRGYREVLAARYKASREWKPTYWGETNPDPIIKIIGDGRLAAIDMRFVYPDSPSDPNSKLNQMIDGLIQQFKASADIEYRDKAGNVEPHKGATMMVFSDLGFGEGAARNRGFNARAWVDKRLRDAGVPASQVAWMSDYKKSADKVKLYRDMNAGRVRVMIGSSKNMGTGVNAQQRMLHLFHLDTPWFPADVEQREGRIVRQGNKNPEVNIHAYAGKGTYDEQMWGLVASKQRFIDQGLSGDPNLREIDDLSEASLAEQAAGMLAEDPRVLQLAGKRADAERLDRLYQAHETQRQRFREQLNRAQIENDASRAQLPKAEAAAKQVVDLSGDKFQAFAGDTAYLKRADWAQALKDRAKDLASAQQPSQTIGSISGFKVRFVSGTDHAGNYDWVVAAENGLGRWGIAELFRDPNDDNNTIARRATYAVADVAKVPATLRDRISQLTAEIDALLPRVGAEWPMIGMLASLRREISELERAIAAGPEVTDEMMLDASLPAALGMSSGENPMMFRLSRGAGGGMDPRQLQALASRVAKALPGLPKVNVLASPADAPQALRAFIERRGAMRDAEGALFEGEIYLFASGLADAQRAEHVLAEHEAAHAGLRGLLGDSVKQAMTAIYNQNQSVRTAADALRKAQGMDLAEAVEEVIVEIPSKELAKLTGWRRLVARVRDALRGRGFTALADQLDRWMAGYLTNDQRADLFVADLVREARAYVAGKRTRKLADDAAAQEKWLTERAKGLGYADIEALLEADYPAFERLAGEWRERNPAAALLSRTATAAPQAPTSAEQRAEAIVKNAASTPKPLDAFARTLTRITGLERLTTTIYGQGARLIERLVPERVKAGIVSDYGVPEAVIDQRARMQGTQREQLRQAGALIEKLASMTRAESRVAYEWMTGEDTRTADEIMADLPEESVNVLREVRALIHELSREAVRLGQLEPEAFERHRFAYLRRSYFKHTTEMTGQEKTARQRAISILGDQYKGRGMTAKAPMRQIQNIAPEWWKRKVVDGKADTSLKGEKFERLERRAAKGEGTAALEGMGEDTRPGKLLEIHYWPAGEPKPAKYADWDSAGTWEVRNTKAGDLIMWRDFTKDERTRMGEIDEARFAIGKTLHRMIHDIEVGRYLEWLAQNHARKPGEQFAGTIVEASERYRDTFTPTEWVQVPDASIPGTSAKKYGKLAGLYLPGPIWNDLRQVVGGRFMPLGETYQSILRMWKISKTALSPGVHTNNVMSNFVMADWHDVSAGHVAKSLRIILGASERKGKGAIGRAGNLAGNLGIADREAAQAILTRYENSGGSIGGWVTQEIANEQMAPIVEALQKELNTTAANAAPAEIGVYSALQHTLHARFPQAWEAFKASRPATAVATDGQNLIDLYQAEDDVFRLAAWLKAKEAGMTDAEAGKVARRSFLDYSINAPWVQALRSTVLPFVSFTYRAVPMLLEVAGKRPHKIVKLMMLAGAINALGWLLAGGDDDEEKVRKLLPEEKAGGLWGMVPKLIRVPWNDQHGSPVFLDVRRWVPAGDVLDLGQGNAAVPIPPALMPGGPLAVMAEIIFNKSMFTAKPITLETDTNVERAGKVMDHLWKAAAPNILGLPNTYATTGVAEAMQGRTDAFGREMSVPQAVASTAGVKLGSYPIDVLRRNVIARRDAQVSEIDRQISQLKRQRQTQRIDQQEFEEKVRAQMDKKRKVMEEAAAKLN